MVINSKVTKLKGKKKKKKKEKRKKRKKKEELVKLLTTEQTTLHIYVHEKYDSNEIMIQLSCHLPNAIGPHYNQSKKIVKYFYSLIYLIKVFLTLINLSEEIYHLRFI
jgi:hypothetical protein